MKIIIAGAGEVGFNLIENLCKEDLDIIVIDTNKEVLKKLEQEFHVTIDQSNIIDSQYLGPSHLKDTDLFLAITNSDETNMIACKMASEGGVKQTVCRIRQINFTDSAHISLKTLGIDVVINPVSLVAEELFHLVSAPNVVDSHEFCRGKITLVGFKMGAHSSLLNKTLGELEPQLVRRLFQVAMIQRQDMSIIPHKEVEILEDDVVYFYCRADEFQKLKSFVGYGQRKLRAKRVFINGGGHIGLRLAQHLEDAHIEVKIIEKDPARALRISEKLEKSLVLNFDGTDLKQLIAEGIEHADFFFSVTDNDSINLTSCLLACEQNVRRTICLIKQPEYSTILDKNSPIYLGVSPRLLTARYLTRFIQGPNIEGYFSFNNSEIEVLEIRLDKHIAALNTSLQALELPEDVRISLIKRDRGFLIPTGETILQEGDTIILTIHRMDRQETMHLFQSNQN